MNTRIVIIMYAIVVNLKLMQHDNCGMKANSTRMFVFNVGHGGFPCLLRYHTCHLRFAALVRQQTLYMMCFAQTAQHLYSVVQTKNRSVLQHRGLNKQNTWLFRWCRETNAISLNDVTYCSLVTRRQHRNLSELSVPSLGARQRFLVEMTTENVAFVCTVRYSRCWQPINDCPRPR